VFAGFRKREAKDPSPDSLTDDERSYMRERMEAGANVAARVVRKVVRLSDERMVKLQRIERVVKQARDNPQHYPGSHVVSIVEAILSGTED
jgi:hypothetical protein